ncbi:hypothetical protein EMCRGX_G032869 [Ephydatia muelleri]
MEVFNKEIAKLSNNSEKIYRLLEAHFAPIDRGCIVPDSCPAGYKGTTDNLQLDESHFISHDPKITESLNEKCRVKLKLKKVLNEKKH